MKKQSIKCPECGNKITLGTEMRFIKEKGLCLACYDEIMRDHMALEFEEEKKQQADDQVIREICEAFDVPIYE